MMHLQNAVGRVMSLFRMYELFPHDPEFVQLTAIPVIAADLGARLSHHIWHDRMFAHYFLDGVLHEYNKGLVHREFTIVQNLKITGLHENNSKEIELTWTTIFGPPGVVHAMKISLRNSRAEADLEFTKAQGRIAAVIQLLRKHDQQQETK